MVTYKEQIEKKKYFEVMKENITLGVFTSFKKLCEAVKESDDSFPSYWTLVKFDREKPMIVKDYVIKEFKINTLKK